MKPLRSRRCRHCDRHFVPDFRNAHHQRFCSDTACQGVSKWVSQRRWLRAPDNRNHFCGQVAVRYKRTSLVVRPNWYQQPNAFSRAAHPAFRLRCNLAPRLKRMKPAESNRLWQRVVEVYTRRLRESPAVAECLRVLNISDPLVLEHFQAGYSDGTLPALLPKSGEVVEALRAQGLLKEAHAKYHPREKDARMSEMHEPKDVPFSGTTAKEGCTR